MASGRGEGRARLERPAEAVRADPDPDAGRVERVDLGLGDEVARVDEAEADHLAVGLGRRGAAQGDERVVHRARGPAVAAHRLPSRAQRTRDDVVLARPCPAELDELPARVRQVERGAHHAGQPDGGRPVVADPRAPGHHGPVAEDRVRQLDGEAAALVGEHDLERFRLLVGLDVGHREAVLRRTAGLAGADAVLDVDELEDARAVGQLDGQGRHPVVARTRRRAFERDRVADAVGEAGERPASRRGRTSGRRRARGRNSDGRASRSG